MNDMNEPNYELDFLEWEWKSLMEQNYKCSMCSISTIGINTAFIGPDANPVCKKCVEFMRKEIKYAN